jgi:ATP synthase protein I
MKSDTEHEKLKDKVKVQTDRIRKAEREKRTLVANTIYLGTLGVIFVLPIVVGAYLGSWLDSRSKGYSFSWTVTLIVLGTFIGAINVYLFVRE